MKQGCFHHIIRALALSCGIVAAQAQATIPASERAVLDAIYQQTGGPNWRNNSGWEGPAGTECTWFGIVCDSGQTHVTQVILSQINDGVGSGNGLVGTLPSISALTALERFDASNNGTLSGALPSLAGFTSLTFFNAEGNQFSGNVPPLTGLVNLQFYAIDSNQLSGPLPSLAGLANLQTFFAFSNQLNGSIPPLTGLSSLKKFYVFSNQFSGNIPNLSGLSNLAFFVAFDNQLTGSIPSLAGLTSPQRLSLSRNQLSGSIPSLSGLVNLQTLALGLNRLTGTIPSLQGLTSLTALGLGSNQLTGTLPDVSAFPGMLGLEFQQNQFTGSIPSLSGLTKLSHFYANENQLTGGIPDLSTLATMDTFDVHGNRLTGSIPALSRLVNLEYFDASNNRLAGSLPSLAGLSSLAYFFVSNNQFTGTIPPPSASTSLIAYFVDGNQLTGSIPALSALPNLQYLDVHTNRLTGSIPPLTGMTELLSLAVYDNELTGQIPPLAGSPKLTAFLAGQNRLTGPAPDLTTLTSLYNFSVGANGLTGDPPFPPATLGANGSSLCNNAFNHVASAAWDAAVAFTPWYQGCTVVPSTLTLSAADTTVATGTKTTITARVTTPGKALVADSASASAGTVTVTDDGGALICYIKLDSTGTGSCEVLLTSGSTTTLDGGYSGTSLVAPASTAFSKTTPVAVPGNLDQHGWTGTWYNPATSGQGIVFEIYPDTGGPGTGTLGGGWFTFSSTVGGEDQKRWITLQGPVKSDSASTHIDLYNATGGNFNASPVIKADHIGYAVLNFTDCQHGNLSYSISGGPTGNVPLNRLDANVTCDPTNGAGNGTAPGKFLLSGAWYTPSTSGQGVLFDINPLQNITVAAWYTYAPNGESVGGGASQRWYTLQIGSANVGASALGNIGIFSAQGGLFDAPGAVTTPQVGTASIVFGNCNALTLNYTFSTGTNAGQSGSVNLQRAGPTPAGCSL